MTTSKKNNITTYGQFVYILALNVLNVPMMECRYITTLQIVVSNVLDYVQLVLLESFFFLSIRILIIRKYIGYSIIFMSFGSIKK